MSDIERKVSYWIEMAEYDLETARVMLDGGRYLYVGFMCHQAIEKVLKGYIWKKSGAEPAYTHSLARLLADAGLDNATSTELRDFVDILEPLKIETRYPTDREKLMRSMNRERSISILDQTKELYTWIKAKL
jgi:HEPN domain-containing protein